jgi:hypothetical protein
MGAQSLTKICENPFQIHVIITIEINPPRQIVKIAAAETTDSENS